MKNMKSLIVALALVIGTVGIAKAGGRQGQGWNVTIVTGTAATIFEGRGFLKKIVLSSGTTTSSGDYLVAFATAPSPSNGAGISAMPPSLFMTTAAVTPAIVYNTTSTVAGVGTQINNVWNVGDAPNDFVEIGGDEQTGASFGLHIRQSVQATGQANTAAVYWSR